MNNSNKKYYVVESLTLANALMYVTGQKPYVFNNRIYSNKKVWSFIKDEAFESALKVINRVKKEFYK